MILQILALACTLNLFYKSIQSLSLHLFKYQIAYITFLNWIYVLYNMRLQFWLMPYFLQILNFSLNILFLCDIFVFFFTFFSLLNCNNFNNARKIMIKWNSISYFSLTSFWHFTQLKYEFWFLTLFRILYWNIQIFNINQSLTSWLHLYSFQKLLKILEEVLFIFFLFIFPLFNNFFLYFFIFTYPWLKNFFIDCLNIGIVFFFL